MTDRDVSGIFNIGSQHGNISNVVGDMTVHGGQQYTAVPVDMIRQELGTLRGTIAAMDLSPEDRLSLGALLTDADRELDQPVPDTGKIAGHIARVANFLKGIGEISAGGTVLIQCFQHIAAWLGTAGQEILHIVT